MGRISLLTFGVLFATLRIFAQGSFEFVENKGQWSKEIQYRGELSSGSFFLQKQGFTVLLHNRSDLDLLLDLTHGHEEKNAGKKGVKNGSRTVVDTEDHSSNVLRSHAYRMRFVGAGNPELVAEKPVDSYNNYFIGNDPSKWAANVPLYQAITYKNVYPNIDVRYYSENGSLKYDIIVRPGGDVRNIVMRYEGAEKLSIRNNELVIKTSVGDVKELYPYSFQFDQEKGKREVECQFRVRGNDVTFEVGEYSRDATLVIDPVLVFSTFTGSSADNYGFTATPGPDGSFFSGGIVFSAGFPTTPGAYKQTFSAGGNPGVDIGIMKFSPNGSQRRYATYLGGNLNDLPHSLFCDPAGNLVVMGRTYSTNYPGSKIGPSGPDDCNIAVTKFNASGSNIIGSLRIGGSDDDGLNIEDQIGGSHTARSLIQNYGDDSRSEVILDAANNIYVAAQTLSDNFPIRGGGFQSAIGGKQDGVIIKINPDCNDIIWSSYIGGSDDDGAFVLSLNPLNGNLYVAGATLSTQPSFPGDKSGTIQPSHAGGIDGFVSIIANNGQSILKTTFLGTSATDVVYGIQFDRNGFPYVMGISRGNWLVRNAPFSNPGSKQFVGKLRADLSDWVYSTVFGSGAAEPNISPVAFLVDRCENVYISGWGGQITRNAQQGYNIAGTAGMPVTSDAIKPTTDNNDFYFIVIEKNAQRLLYGTFFGQNGGAYTEHVDGGTSRYDQEGVIYQAICANCNGGAVFPTTPGVVGPTNNALPQGCNLAAVKISFNFAGVGSGPKAYFNNVPDTVGCVPFTLDFRDTIRNAKSYVWNFGDGSPDVTTPDYNVSHTFNAVGTYRVRLIAIDSTTCNIRDTGYLNIRVRDDVASLNFNPVKLPPCESLSYRFDNLSFAPPGKPFGAISFTWDFGDGTRVTSGSGAITHAFAGPGTYRVRLILRDTNYCNAPDSVEQEIRVAPLVDARFLTPSSGCAPYNATFNNTSLAGASFFWDFGDGTTSTEVDPVHLYTNVGSYRVRLVVTDPATCNLVDSTEQTINVYGRPTADFNTTPIPPEVNKPTVFYNLSTGGARYKWLFGDGDSTIKNSMDTVMHQYNATGVYQACLITYNEFGCTDTICSPVEAQIEPLLDVPNAFTPGRFGRNSIVRVEGFGIARMTWRIYNRWGQKVFESSDRKVGWDGTFKGQIQPMDVYAYTLDVEFIDGTTTRKTGDITLIR